MPTAGSPRFWQARLISKSVKPSVTLLTALLLAPLAALHAADLPQSTNPETSLRMPAKAESAMEAIPCSSVRAATISLYAQSSVEAASDGGLTADEIAQEAGLQGGADARSNV